MKLLITLLIVITPMVANGQGILATAEDTSTIMVGTITDLAVWNAADSLISTDAWGWPVKRNTTKEYVSAIEDKCDTAWTKQWVPYEKIKGTQYFKHMAAIDSVHCYIDTTWANKTLVYLTPDEMKELKKLLRCHE